MLSHAGDAHTYHSSNKLPKITWPASCPRKSPARGGAYPFIRLSSDTFGHSAAFFCPRFVLLDLRQGCRIGQLAAEWARSKSRYNAGMRFSIRDLLWLTLLAAFAVAWWIDRRQLAAEVERLSAPKSFAVDFAWPVSVISQ